MSTQKDLSVLAQQTHHINNKKNCSRCYCKEHCATSADYVAYWFQGTHSPSLSIIIKQSPFLWTSDRKVVMTVTGLPAERQKNCCFKVPTAAQAENALSQVKEEPEAAPEILNLE